MQAGVSDGASTTMRAIRTLPASVDTTLTPLGSVVVSTLSAGAAEAVTAGTLSHGVVGQCRSWMG